MRIYKTYIKFWPLAILLLLSACYNDSLTSNEGSDEIIVEASIEGLDDGACSKADQYKLDHLWYVWIL